MQESGTRWGIIELQGIAPANLKQMEV
jgi:hypothetical protein